MGLDLEEREKVRSETTRCGIQGILCDSRRLIDKRFGQNVHTGDNPNTPFADKKEKKKATNAPGN